MYRKFALKSIIEKSLKNTNSQKNEIKKELYIIYILQISQEFLLKGDIDNIFDISRVIIAK